MNGRFNPCHSFREELCAGMIDDDCTALEQHWATCADCQKYRDEIRKVTTLLSVSKERFANVQPSEATQMRWAGEFATATKLSDSPIEKVLRGFVAWIRALFLPARWTWAGIASAWLVIFSLNVSQKNQPEKQSAIRPSPEILRALLASEGFLPAPHPPKAGRQHRPKNEPS